ncbi:MAG: S9 family peptidase [Bacteroidales bacterium]|nr:S9 family peptidase [Bacteroidales bacterium]
MKRILSAAALAVAILLAASAHAQPASERTVVKSVTVGTPGAPLLTCKDINSRYTRPQTKWYGWSEDSELISEFPRRQMTMPRLPVSSDPAVTYGKVPSRNEFGINSGWYPSPSGSLVAVYKVDESAVSRFPLLDITTRTGSLKSIRYPMNGMPSEHVDLCVFDTLGNVLATLDVSDFTAERYLAGVTWTPDSRRLLVQVIDRSQHNMHFNVYNAADGSFAGTLFTELDNAWVEPREGVFFVKGTDFFIYRTDVRDGYRQLYLCDMDGSVRRLTACDADVEYVGNDGEWIYYTSAEVSPAENHLFRIRLTKLTSGKKPSKLAKVRIGKPQRLTFESGSHSIALSPDCKKFIDRWSAVDVPGRAVVRSADGKLLEDLYTAEDPIKPYAPVTVEFGTVPSADPAFVNYYRLVKPADFDPSKQYPLIVYVYGGPHSQMVKDSWLGSIRNWELLMAEKGYVLYIQDNRGTDNRGYAFARAINRRCGVCETEDQVEGIRQLVSEGWVDSSRIGVVGWSYGGFMTITLLTSHPELFKAGAAGGPVIDWKWYEVMYGERYMDTAETNPDGFAQTSLVDKAPRLKARLLICQGMEDGTVLPINSLSFMQSCVEHNILPDYYPYPRSEHNVTGPWREQLYLKLTDFFERNL